MFWFKITLAVDNFFHHLQPLVFKSVSMGFDAI